MRWDMSEATRDDFDHQLGVQDRTGNPYTGLFQNDVLKRRASVPTVRSGTYWKQRATISITAWLSQIVQVTPLRAASRRLKTPFWKRPVCGLPVRSWTSKR